MSSPKRLKLSLEPPFPSLPPNSHLSTSDPFALPPRLQDINLETGHEVFTRDDPDKSVEERLKRIWSERGDFSELTSKGILEAMERKKAGLGEEVKEEKENDEDGRPSAEDMRTLSRTLLEQLDVARQELLTSLSLLTVLSPAPDPTNGEAPSDPSLLPLPHGTLSLTHTAPLAPLPPTSTSSEADNASEKLPLAISLAALSSSATSFFSASRSLSSPSSSSSKSNFPLLLSLQASPFPLIPLGAQKGATLTGKNETKLSKNVGVFYGFEEAKEGWRRRSVVGVEQLGKAEGEGRRLCVRVRVGDGDEEVACWDGFERNNEKQKEGVEGELRERSRSIFAEELFALLSNEARTNTIVKARLNLGKKKEMGDEIVIEGYKYTLIISMIPPNSPQYPKSSSAGTIAKSILYLLILLFIQEYKQRRLPPSTLLWNRQFLQSLSILLQTVVRVTELRRILDEFVADVNGGEVEWFGSKSALKGEKEEVKEWIEMILGSQKELGGRAIIRLSDPKTTYHLTHSLLLPAPSSVVYRGIPPYTTHQSLILRKGGSSTKGKRGDVVVPGLEHLKLFLGEMRKEDLAEEKEKRVVK